MYKYISTRRLIIIHILKDLIILFLVIAGICHFLIEIINKDFSENAHDISYSFSEIANKGVEYIIENAIPRLYDSYQDKKKFTEILHNMIKERKSTIFHSFIWSNIDNNISIIATRNKLITDLKNHTAESLLKIKPEIGIKTISFGKIVEHLFDHGTKIVPVYTSIFDKSNQYIGTLFVIIDVNTLCVSLKKSITTKFSYLILEDTGNSFCSISTKKISDTIKNTTPIKQLNYIHLLKTIIFNKKYNYQFSIEEYPATIYLLINKESIMEIIKKEQKFLSLFVFLLILITAIFIFTQRIMISSYNKKILGFINSFTKRSSKTNKISGYPIIEFRELIIGLVSLKRAFNRLNNINKKTQEEIINITKKKHNAYLIAETTLLRQEEVNAKIQEIKIANKIINDKYEYMQQKVTNSKQKTDNILNLLAEVNHELRTPLSTIIGFTELILINNKIEPQIIEYLNYIKNCSHYLLYLVKDIIDILRIEEDAVRLEETTVCMKEMIQSCISYMQNDIKEKNIVINSYINQNIPLLYVDKYRIRQIILNILANSIKYMGKDGNAIDIYCYCTKSEGFVLIIKDNGTGIPENEMKKIFNKYTRGNSQQNIEGFGLGMSLIEKLVKMHNSQLIIESKINMGTKTTIVFPETRIISSVQD